MGDVHNIHQTTVSRCVAEVSRKFTSLLPQYIRMEPENFDHIQQQFKQYRGFPRVVGCIDCTHVHIKSPGGENAEYFRNRKNRFSINVQAVCDYNLKLTNLIARWPGSTHDSRIYQRSQMSNAFERDPRYKKYHLLGDSGYACSAAILTPFRDPATILERNYNNSQIPTRIFIERCFGLIKRRFPCLKKELETRLDNTLYIITAVGRSSLLFIMHKNIK